LPVADYGTCKRLGASYCSLPASHPLPVCSGRRSDPICGEVLNDTWVSLASFSEDSQFVASRKTQLEELVSRTEEERFEFDAVAEANRDTARVLERVQKRMARMGRDEAAAFRLDDCLGELLLLLWWLW
jgi:paired amphipathic helix protein Sin3a